jgi:hypothetical protein
MVKCTDVESISRVILQSVKKARCYSNHVIYKHYLSRLLQMWRVREICLSLFKWRIMNDRDLEPKTTLNRELIALIADKVWFCDCSL